MKIPIPTTYWVPHPPAYSEGEGLNYSETLAERTQTLSLYMLILGWCSVILGALLAIAGSVFGSGTDSADSFLGPLGAHPGLLSSTFAIVFAGAGWQILDRAAAATIVASIATRAIQVASSNDKHDQNKSPDKTAYDICVDAKTAWLEGRMNNDRLESIVNSLKPPK